MSINALGRVGFQQIMRLAKESVTRRSRIIAYDSNDDVSYTNTDTTISVVVQIISLDDIEVYGGKLAVGDAVMFTDNNTTVNKSDLISHNSIWYEVVEQTPESPLGSNVFTEYLLKREEYVVS